MTHTAPSTITVENPNHRVHFSTGGVSLLIDLSDRLLPAIVHWGADLGELRAADAANLATANVQPVVPNSVDEPVRVALLPEHFTGWSGRPGLAGSRRGATWSPRFIVDVLEITSEDEAIVEHADGPTLVSLGPGALVVHAADAIAELRITIQLEVAASGLVRSRATLRNDGDDYVLDELALAFPLPGSAREILDFAGRWALERVPQRRELTVGTHLREGRRGRTGADAATVLTVGVPGFGFAAGETWGLHVGFSGNHRHYAERLFSGAQVVGGGELLLPGEVVLARGEGYSSPWIYAVYGDGLDDQASRFHDYLRSRPSHPSPARPVTINVWEAVYFDHDLARLRGLADLAASIGVERYVLDDGWFRHRRDDTAGLGDWFVDSDVWPDGLGPIVDHVRGLGMQFGLWFEPEMINPDSDLAREHPEWIMQTGGRLPVLARNQQVLDLGIPEAYEHVLERISAILDEYPIDYIKWDHNRDLVDAGTLPSGRPGVHEQTLAVYRMMDALRERHKGLEIESCSSGGGRVDLGILERTDRVWVSDCIDPLDRQRMNRWTQQLLPPELLGSHVASARSHTTGRTHDLSFRAATAFFGHFGIEWDLATATDADVTQLREWIGLYRANRELLHSGTIVRMDSADSSLWVNGVVARDADSAVFSLAYMSRSEVSPRGRFTIRGLSTEKRYAVRPIVIGEPNGGFVAPAWFGTPDVERRYPGTVLSGRSLEVAGLQAPGSYPEQAFLLDIRALD